MFKISVLLLRERERKKLWWIAGTWHDSKLYWYWFEQKAWKTTIRFIPWGWHVRTGRKGVHQSLLYIREANSKNAADRIMTTNQVPIIIIFSQFPKWNLKSINIFYIKYFSKTITVANPHLIIIHPYQQLNISMRCLWFHTGTRKVSWSALAMIAYEFLINIKVKAKK